MASSRTRYGLGTSVALAIASLEASVSGGNVPWYASALNAYTSVGESRMAALY